MPAIVEQCWLLDIESADFAPLVRRLLPEKFTQLDVEKEGNAFACAFTYLLTGYTSPTQTIRGLCPEHPSSLSAKTLKWLDGFLANQLTGYSNPAHAYATLFEGRVRIAFSRRPHATTIKDLMKQAVDVGQANQLKIRGHRLYRETTHRQLLAIRSAPKRKKS